jgi:hypothetical protein
MKVENTSNQKLSESYITISASEVHEFFYCPYAWWFQDTSQNHLEQLQRGANYHTEFSGQQVSTRNCTLNWLLPTIAVILALAAVVFYFIGNR